LSDDVAEIHKAIEGGNTHAAGKLAHKLKGSAANLSAEPLRLACSQLQDAAASQSTELLTQCFRQVEQAAERFLAAAKALLETQAPTDRTADTSPSESIEEYQP